MKLMSTILSILVILALTPSVALCDDDKQNLDADTAIYAKALQKARAARIKELETLLSGRKRSGRSNARTRKAAIRAKAELKRLKSDKPLPRNWGKTALKIAVNSPRVGQVGTLMWGKLDDKAERKKCTVERVMSATAVLARTHWDIEHHAVAKSFKIGGSGFAPSVKIAEDRIEGPLLLFTGVSTAGLREGGDIKTTDTFVVEGRRAVDGEPAFVLRKLNINR